MRKRTANADQIVIIVQEILDNGIMSMEVIYNYQTREWIVVSK